MELTKFGHACVRLDDGDRRLVIDPGGLTDPAAVEGASAILVTHEHFDHFSESTLRAAAEADPELEIWTNGSVARQLDGLRVHTVGEGAAFTAAGFNVKVYGTWHAVIHRDIPRIGNIGFLVDDRLFHPGDALTVPEDATVDTLLLPVHAPWSATRELIDYVREVAPQRAVAVHDGALNEVGLTLVGGLLGEKGPGIGAPYARLTPGESLTVS
ncbi:MBL fold metallo-hydrolase [Microbispora sp. NPDC049125]|uniref:MBL fold metallo-hydrolase n=1 Tax=Microbispora sp. NPDC049125 TaxID=3154929 RepID=UPI003465C464